MHSLDSLCPMSRMPVASLPPSRGFMPSVEEPESLSKPRLLTARVTDGLLQTLQLKLSGVVFDQGMARPVFPAIMKLKQALMLLHTVLFCVAVSRI
ncbi:hypothetical protein OE88DRAFT_1142899 [Heliocybe sulcata]|uniref:Uncharacterized protein n=1 Tax=Heliocybe sulcata TaxID=5364 RepID=A0A5C3N9N4_9AGAM|nr:hypothetical protein OE88DRAFT_1142899 [Heliocybe sulcata]